VHGLTIGAGSEDVKTRNAASDTPIMTKECPQCGEFMRISLREEIRQIPGTSQVLRQPIREWICPECDYFEEADREIDEE
jgi:C4-type Zn-finger protein